MAESAATSASRKKGDNLCKIAWRRGEGQPMPPRLWNLRLSTVCRLFSICKNTYPSAVRWRVGDLADLWWAHLKRISLMPLQPLSPKRSGPDLPRPTCLSIALQMPHVKAYSVSDTGIWRFCLQFAHLQFASRNDGIEEAASRPMVSESSKKICRCENRLCRLSTRLVTFWSGPRTE